MTAPDRQQANRITSVTERLSGMLKALGNPVRFQIMQTLAERRTCITQRDRGDDPTGAIHRKPAPEGAARGGFDPGRDRRTGDLLLHRPGWGALAQGADRELVARMLQ